MLPEIEQLLIIQDRDQNITKLNADIDRLPLEEEQAKQRLKKANELVETSQSNVKENEVQISKIELDIETRKRQHYQIKKPATRDKKE